MKISSLAYDWFEAALDLKDEEVLFIPCSTRKEQSKLCKEIIAARDKYKEVSSKKASHIMISPTFKDGNLWIKIVVNPISAYIGFKQLKNGTTERVDLKEAGRRTQQIKQLIQDGNTKQAIDKLLELTKEEERRFFSHEQSP